MVRQQGRPSGGRLLAAGLLWGGAAIGLLVWQPTASQGVRQGLSICAQTLIPSLFPFMALSGVMANLGADRLLAAPFAPVLSRLLKIPPALCGPVLMSFLGGYPVGARLVARLQREGRIDPSTARRMMVFSFAGAPSFLIGAVGIQVLGGPLQGLVVYLAQVAAALLLGSLWGRRRSAGPIRPPKEGRPLTPSAALVEGVSGAATGMLVICAFACLFAAVSALLEEAGLPGQLGRLLETVTGGALPEGAGEVLLSGLLEITCGVQRAADLPYGLRFLLVPFLLSFGSLSVLCQVAASFEGLPFSFGWFAGVRFLHGLLTALLAAPILFRIPLPAQVFSSLPQPAPMDGTMVLGIPAMVGMCSVLLLTLCGESGSLPRRPRRLP